MKTCSIVNVVESSIARDSDYVYLFTVDQEVGVASTKAFMGQLLVLYLLTLKLSFLRDKISKENHDMKISSLLELPKLIENTLKIERDIQEASKDFSKAKGSMFFWVGLFFSNCIRRCA